VLCAEFRQHLRHDRLQFGQVNRHDFPRLRVVETLVFVPQYVADPDSGAPWRTGVENQLAALSRLPKRSARRVPPHGGAGSSPWYCANETPRTEGVRTRDGRVWQADALVFATGFKVSKMLHPMAIVGKDGRELHDIWGPDDAKAYPGLTVPGFPNFFMLTGPNTGWRMAATRFS
jgi:hypothetical protein